MSVYKKVCKGDTFMQCLMCISDEKKIVHWDIAHYWKNEVMCTGIFIFIVVRADLSAKSESYISCLLKVS